MKSCQAVYQARMSNSSSVSVGGIISSGSICRAHQVKVIRKSPALPHPGRLLVPAASYPNWLLAVFCSPRAEKLVWALRTGPYLLLSIKYVNKKKKKKNE